jgi:heme/copper-type cytochrome/quinol oxidase subunit 1
MFLIGGVSGIFLASAPIDFAAHDTYYVVAHFHYTMFGGTVFAAFAGFYFWIPKITGRMMSESLGKWHFWLMLLGFNLTFFPQFQLGLDGMQRRIANYPAEFTTGNVISTVGAAVLGVSVAIFIANFVRSMRKGEQAGDDPWNANTLEWATTSPPPHHNFHSLPPVRSERPVFDARERHREDARG